VTEAEPIRDAEGVARVVTRARAAGRAALDLEFLWERTYVPLACLAQVAVEGEVHLIDPLAGAPLGPVAELVADPEVVVVMHAPSSDLALLEMVFGTRPTALRDVQVVAAFVGLGAGQGLGTLLERVLRVRLDKAERYTDWSRRPLTRRQLAYAAADVAHLPALADELDARAAALGRAAWVDEEHARRYGPEARFGPDPARAWRKLKGLGRLDPRERAVAAALAAWREAEARRQDRPAAWIVPDRVLVELARRRPADRAALLAERGMPERMRPALADAMLEVIQAGLAAEPMAGPPPLPRALAERLEVLGQLGAVLVAGRAAAAGLAPTLLATRDEIHAYLATVLDGRRDGGPLAAGWRHELAGAALRELAEGRLALAAEKAPPYLAELPRDGAGAPAPAPPPGGSA
jgi:ribonuclease D